MAGELWVFFSILTLADPTIGVVREPVSTAEAYVSEDESLRDWLIGSWTGTDSCQSGRTIQFFPDGTLMMGRNRGTWLLEGDVIVIAYDGAGETSPERTIRWTLTRVTEGYGETLSGERRGQLFRCPTADPTVVIPSGWLIGSWSFSGDCSLGWDFRFSTDGRFDSKAARGVWDLDGNILTLNSAVIMGTGDQVHVAHVSEHSWAIAPRGDDEGQLVGEGGATGQMARC